MKDDVYQDTYSSLSSYSYSDYYGGNYTYTESGDGAIVPVIFGIITIVGLLGNGCVLIVICRNKHMQTVTNYFIMNNAITDIVFLIICAPITASQFLLSDWIYGAFMCKLVAYMQYVSVQASCATLMAMTVDRYRVILHPMKSLHTRTVWRTMFVNLGIWLGSFLLHIPIAIYYGLVNSFADRSSQFCTPQFQPFSHARIYEIYAVFMMYILPFAVMFYCYGRILRRVWTGRRYLSSSSINILRKRRWKVTRMTLLVVILFGLCWGPIHSIHLISLFKIDVEPASRAYQYVASFCLCLSYSNSAINPFLYAFSGRHYRSLLIPSFICCRNRYIPGTPTPSRNTRNNNNHTEHNHYTVDLLQLHQIEHRYHNGSRRCSADRRFTLNHAEKYV